MIFETALADALYLNWSIPLAALPPLPPGLRYDQGSAPGSGGGSHGYFSLVLFRQAGLHLRGASWFALSYPQVNARLYVRDAAGSAAVLLLRQLVPGWVVPIGRLVGGQPLSAAVCEFPGGRSGGLRLGRAAAGDGPRGEDPTAWRWKFAAGARFAVGVEIGASGGGVPGGGATWEEQVAFFRDRPRTFWRQGEALRRMTIEPAPVPALPVRARIELAGWLETYLPFAPAEGWTALHSAFLVPKVQLVFAFDTARDLPVAAPMAAAG
ncbi:MAG: DUF2071 domain-containing protein [Thermoanaerobaculia bacterium]|nr:DUF2071 domain-containing protein [Thermoanaerobaculia bacterium]